MLAGCQEMIALAAVSVWVSLERNRTGGPFGVEKGQEEKQRV